MTGDSDDQPHPLPMLHSAPSPAPNPSPHPSPAMQCRSGGQASVPMDVDLPPAPPLPAGLLGQRWVFHDGVYEVDRATPLREQPPTPPAVVPPRGNGLLQHLY